VNDSWHILEGRVAPEARDSSSNPCSRRSGCVGLDFAVTKRRTRVSEPVGEQASDLPQFVGQYGDRPSTALRDRGLETIQIRAFPIGLSLPSW
jgi:hypothetical protein